MTSAILRSPKLKKRSRKIAGSVFRLLILGGLSFILIYPVLFMISFAFRAPSDMQDPMVVWVPKTLVWDNLYKAAVNMHFADAVVSTFKIGFVSTLLQLVSCASVGYGMARFNFKIKKILLVAVIITILVPPQITIMPSYLHYSYFDFFGLGKLIGLFTGTDFSIRLVNNPILFYILSGFGMGIRSGLFIFIFMQFFKGMPRELEEAAYIDGNGPLKTFIRIILPNAVPAFMTVTLFSLVWYWNDFFYSAMYTPKYPTVSVSLSTMAISLQVEVFSGRLDKLEMSTVLQAGSLLAVLPLLLIYIFLQRYFTESIERTGIVG